MSQSVSWCEPCGGCTTYQRPAGRSGDLSCACGSGCLIRCGGTVASAAVRSRFSAGGDALPGGCTVGSSIARAGAAAASGTQGAVRAVVGVATAVAAGAVSVTPPASRNEAASTRWRASCWCGPLSGMDRGRGALRAAAATSVRTARANCAHAIHTTAASMPITASSVSRPPTTACSGIGLPTKVSRATGGPTTNAASITNAATARSSDLRADGCVVRVPVGSMVMASPPPREWRAGVLHGRCR